MKLIRKCVIVKYCITLICNYKANWLKKLFPAGVISSQQRKAIANAPTEENV